MRRLLAILLLVLMFGSVSAIPAQAKTFKNCDDLRKVYKYGISLSGKAVNRGVGPIFPPKVSATVFKLNTRLDLDGDKIVCEVVRAKPSATASPAPAPTPTATKFLTLTPYPRIGYTTSWGNHPVGSTLTANPGTWDSGVTLRYQWLKDDVAITGATDPTYTTKLEDYPKTPNSNSTRISVQVIGSKAGFKSVTRTSASLFLSQITSTPTPSPTPISTTIPAQIPYPTPSATPTQIPYPTPSATPTQIPTPTPSATPTQIPTPTPSAKPTQMPTPSPTKPNLDSTPTPEPSGIARVGSTLDANPGTWTSGVSLSYQWLRNGSAIAGASSRTYTLVTADGGTSITVQVTGSKSGFNSATRTSAALAISFPAESTPNPTPNLTLTPTPTIGGDGRVGNTLTAETWTWDSGVTLSYQWLRNGSAISGATARTYRLVNEDGGTEISVRVTGTKVGYNSATKTSSGSFIYVTCTLVPTISGEGIVGQTLNLVVVRSNENCAVGSYFRKWLRNGAEIDGATGPTYTLTPSDAGQSITVSILRLSSGAGTSVSTWQFSSPVTVYTPFSSIRGVSITINGIARGQATQGQTLTAQTGSWGAGVVLSYQWLRNGSVISGANGITYTVNYVDRNTQISVRVTGSAPGYNSVEKTSDPIIVR